MIDANDFASDIGSEQNLSETDIAVRVAWYISTSKGTPAQFSEIVEFIESHGIRHNINRYRLKKKLSKDKRVSAPSGKPISVTASERKFLIRKYSGLASRKTVKILDKVLVAEDFAGSRKYVSSLVNQINGCHQFGFYDGCAVLMRRLVEVLIIDFFEREKIDEHIRDADGNLLMLSGLISVLKSGRFVRLSRNAPGHLAKIKELGDTAAHSKNYVTKRMDIEDFSLSYRRLIDELRGLVRR